MNQTFRPDETHDLRLSTLAQLARGGDWRITLAHDRSHHLLVWTTRGQGRALVGGAQRGIGTHNAIFVPAGELMALQPGRQMIGLALLIPPKLGLPLPDEARHLRIRDASTHAEIIALLDGLGQEQSGTRNRWQSAMSANADLVAIWLRRQLADPDHAEPTPNAARLLSRAFCARVSGGFASGDTMADHARWLGVTATHLTRICRAETGRSAANLLAERRLHAARQLLSDTTATIGNIARHLGFTSPAQFSRFVQRHTGQAPTALRRRFSD